jgi:hypothetical protein
MASFGSVGIFATVHSVEVEQDLLCCWAGATLVKHFEVSRLYQGIAPSSAVKVESLGDFRSDRIAPSRSLPTTMIFVD